MKVFAVNKNNQTTQQHFLKEVKDLNEAVAEIQKDRASKFLSNRGKLVVEEKDNKTTYIQSSPSDGNAYVILK